MFYTSKSENLQRRLSKFHCT
uniref:Uncharacterized protein n=1 Tax=Arundo donax TaxID=35708 RepID=A0A0A9B655_ARUDO